MFHGTIVERHGLSTALEALAQLKDDGPDIRFDVYGDGDYVEQFLALVDKLGLEDVVSYHGFVSLETIADAIETVDLGLIPNMRSTFTEINLPTRIFEYLCKGKPVIVPRTKGILDYFTDEDILFFEPGDANSLADAIQRARSNRDLRERVLERGTRVYAKHSWRLESQKLVDIVARLIGVERPAPSYT
jgi:glycosyltransferase involved in cell wall biosynthesis